MLVEISDYLSLAWNVPYQPNSWWNMQSNAKDNKISLGHVFAKYISFLKMVIDVWVKFFIIYQQNDMSHTN